MDKSKRNRNAGRHASYDKRGMTPAQIKKKRAYDKAYHATPARKKYRAELNSANRKSQKAGKTKVGDGLDKSHTKSNRLVNESQKGNRARNGSNSKSTKK